MKDQIDIILAAKEYVKESMKKNDPSHDYAHVERVWKNALFLANDELKRGANLDMMVVELAALFHDIVDFKYDHDKSKSLREIAEERLQEFFAKNNHKGCTSQQQESIIDIILNISWRKELEQPRSPAEMTTEFKIVQDSDRLDAIGAVGIARCFAFSGAKMRPFYIPDLPPIENMSSEQYNQQTIKNQSTAINHFYEKLLLIKSKMKTSAGQELAEKRHQYMLAFLKQFDDECQLLS